MFDHLRQWWHSRRDVSDHAKKRRELPVYYLVYDSEDDPVVGQIIVFIDFVGDLDTWRDHKATAYTADNNYDRHVAEILNEVALLEPQITNWPKDLKISIKRMLGEAVVRVFLCERESADAAIRNAKVFIQEKSKDVSRYWILQACSCAAGVAAAGGIILIWKSSLIIGALGPTTQLLLLAGCCGGIGALLSIILRLGKLGVNASAERRLHFAEGVARIVAGSVAGVLIGSLVKLGILFPVFTQTGMPILATCTAAIVAGASERLAPDMIKKFESEKTTKNGESE